MKNTVWVINEDSRSYNWSVVAETENQARKEFKRMWLAWCKATGAERDYWGKDCEDIYAQEIELNIGYMDKEIFK